MLKITSTLLKYAQMPIDSVGTMLNRVLNDPFSSSTIIPQLKELANNGEPVCDQLSAMYQSGYDQQLISMISEQIGCNDMAPVQNTPENQEDNSGNQYL
jgi:hypothetical protein